MAKLNKKNHDLMTLPGRLAFCMAKVGGKRQLAAAAFISEAQLFRYVNGITDLPSEKLLTIAKVAEVDAGWLLNGQDASVAAKGTRPSFRPALMRFTSRMLDEFLLEYQRHFTPRVKSHLLTLVYEALRHDEVLTGEEILPNKFQLLSMLSFMEALRTEEQIALYQEAMEILEYKRQPLSEHFQMFKAFASLIVQGYEAFYSSYVGKAYYERVGQHLLETTENETHSFIRLALETFKQPDLKLLDLGCGNGRNLAFIHKHYPKLRLEGIDIAKPAIELCKTLEKAGKIPEGTATQADCCALPYGDKSMDLVYSQCVLHYLPYLPGTGLGLEMAWKEIHRVLKSNGLVLMSMPFGEGRSYGMFTQFITLDELNTLAAEQGFKLVSYTTEDFFPVETDQSVRACTLSMRYIINAVLQKIN